MAKGKIAYFHNNYGKLISEGVTYNFHIDIVEGGVALEKEVEFELDNGGYVKIVYGKGAEKPQPKKKKQESKNTSSKILLTEEK